MHRIFVVFAVMLAISLPLHAQKSEILRYRWHDASGLTHYSDSLTSQAMAAGYDLVNDQGMAVRHVARPPTTQERVAARKLAEQQAAQQRAQAEQARADQQMLAAYPDEASFVASQRSSLDNVDQQIATTRANLRTQERALTDLLSRAGDFERSSKQVPKSLTDAIAAQRGVVASQRSLLERLRNTRRATEENNQVMLQRYRSLKAAASAAEGNATS